MTGYDSVTDFMNNKTKKFTALWQRDHDLLEDLQVLVRELFEDASIEAMSFENPTKDDINGAFHGIKNGRAGGSDFIRKQDVTRLPNEGLEELGEIMGQTVRELALPSPMLLNCIALAPKPKGGERPITVTSIIYGVLIRLFSGTLMEWTEHHKGFWDDAVKGSSALTAALCRSAEAEIAQLQGKQTAGVFWDCETFFDSICLIKLVKAASAMGFSPLVLYLGLQCHMATRVFKIGNWTSDIIEPNASIIAGCHLTDRFTKIIFYNTLELAHSKFLGVKFGQFSMILRKQNQ